MMLNTLYPAPNRSWSEAALRLLAMLPGAAPPELACIEELALQSGPGRSQLRDMYCGKLATVLLKVARSAEEAPLLAATLARCVFGQLALQLALKGGADVARRPPWVGAAGCCCLLCLGSVSHLAAAAGQLCDRHWVTWVGRYRTLPYGETCVDPLRPAGTQCGLQILYPLLVCDCSLTCRRCKPHLPSRQW
jgi:hypothetical protein